ncbi:MAG TPA: hypothetical protein VNQ31_05090, partial [Sphingomonadaceae bacterium]|nr:hypothetical protein [Sphingomonadaceae bacterium]
TLQALAQMALLAGNLAQARDYIDTLLVLVPQDVRGRLLQAGLALRERRYGDAAPVLDSLAADGVDTDEFFVLKAQLLAGAGKLDEAAAALEPRVAASDAKQVLLGELLKIYQQKKDHAGIEATYRRLVALTPDDAAVVLQYARMRYADGAVAEARRLAEGLEARARKGGSDTISAIARFWAEVAPPPVAVAELSRIAAAGDLNRKAVVADLLTDIGRADLALALLDPLVGDQRVDAANVAAQVASARALSVLGRAAEARARVDRALAFDGTNTFGLKLRAQLALASGELDRALADAQLFASVEPDFADAALLVARIQARRGDHVLAERGFAHAMTRFPDSLAVAQAYVAYQRSRHRFREASAIADRFALRHPASAGALRLRAATCAEVGDQGCVAETKAALARLAAGEPPPPERATPDVADVVL